ncbi:hypothetical protein ACFO1B_35625 [Dactylosporangium siamense]|uniref:Uncharacterized protein n=1 Tax=Dactylosporangium siamense TaxID=685454 RepID=A0A919PMF9_9ACTN|nr:hypothetical protein [Dactylosporangium siamense]GIG45906.1 hypothetical protein Dsi01nite_039470 [Dactylosporangium siamense]
MYRAGDNCVATIVQWEAGFPSPVVAEIDVEGDGKGWFQDSGTYKYYAAVEAYADGKCIRWGGAHSPEYLVQSQSEFRQEVFTFCG